MCAQTTTGTTLETETGLGEGGGRRVAIDGAREDATDATDAPGSTIHAADSFAGIISPVVLPPAPHLSLDIPAGTIPGSVNGIVIQNLPTPTSVIASARAYITAQLHHTLDTLNTLFLNKLRALRRWVLVGVFALLNASSSTRLWNGDGNGDGNGNEGRVRSNLSVEEMERAGWDLEAYVDGLGSRLLATSNEAENEDANANWTGYCTWIVLECMIFIPRVVPAIYTSAQTHIPHLAPTLALGTLSARALAASSVAGMVASVMGYSLLGGIGSALDGFICLSNYTSKSTSSSPQPSLSSLSPSSSSSPGSELSPSQSSSSETSTLRGSPQISRSSTKTNVTALLTQGKRLELYTYGSTSTSSQATFVDIEDDECDGGSGGGGGHSLRSEISTNNEHEDEQVNTEIRGEGEEEAATWCLRALLIMALVLPPIVSLWLAPDRLLGLLRPKHHTNTSGGGNGVEEDEMDAVIRLAGTYLRVAALGLPAFGVIEVLKRYLGAKGYGWIYPSVLTALNPLVVGLNYLLVDGPLPSLRLGFAAAPAITAGTYNALAVGMMACAGYLFVQKDKDKSPRGFASAGREGWARHEIAGSDGGEVGGGGDVGGIGGGEERPLLPPKKRHVAAKPARHHTENFEIVRAFGTLRALGTLATLGEIGGIGDMGRMFALVKESLICVGANAAQVWSKDLVAFVACLLGPSTLAAQSVLLATVSTAHLVPAATRGVCVARLKKHVDDKDIRRARVVALVGFAFTVLGVCIISTAAVVCSSSIARLVSPDEGVVRIATRAFPTIAVYIAAQGIGAWVDGALNAFGHPMLFSSLVASTDYCVGLPLGVYLIFFSNADSARNGAGEWGIEGVWAGLALGQAAGVSWAAWFC